MITQQEQDILDLAMVLREVLDKLYDTVGEACNEEHRILYPIIEKYKARLESNDPQV